MRIRRSVCPPMPRHRCRTMDVSFGGRIRSALENLPTGQLVLTSSTDGNRDRVAIVVRHPYNQSWNWSAPAFTPQGARSVTYRFQSARESAERMTAIWTRRSSICWLATSPGHRRRRTATLPMRRNRREDPTPIAGSIRQLDANQSTDSLDDFGNTGDARCESTCIRNRRRPEFPGQRHALDGGQRLLRVDSAGHGLTSAPTTT